MRSITANQDGGLSISGVLLLLAAGITPTASHAAPPNDDCASPTIISDGTTGGTTIGATSDGGASCGNSSGSPDVWFLYTAPCNGQATFDTCGSGFDTMLSVHSHTEISSATLFDAGGFESDTPGTHPAAAASGSWSVIEIDDASSSPALPRVEVLGLSSAGPGASRGGQHLSLYKGVGDVVQGIAMLSSPVAEAGKQLTATFGLYVPGTDADGNPRTGGDGTHFQAQFTRSASGGYANRIHWFGLAFPSGDLSQLVSTAGIQPGQMIAVYHDGAWKNLTAGGAPVFVSSNAWHTLSITLTLGASFAVTIDGVASDFVPIDAGVAGASVAGLEFRANVGNRDSSFYIDDLVINQGGDCPAGPANQLACGDNCSGTPCGGSSSCVTFPISQGTKVRLRVAGVNGSSGNFVLHASCLPVAQPPNDACTEATVITTGQIAGTTIGATNDGTTTCGSSGASPDVWYSYTAPGNGNLFVVVTGASSFTQAVVSLHSDCPGTAGNTLACGSGGIQSGFSATVTAGTTYRIRVSGMSGAQGDFLLVVQFTPPPPPVQNALDPILKFTWHIGPDLPQGFQDSDGGIIDNTLITVGGFCSGESVPSKPGRYPRGFLRKAWGLDLANRQNGWFTLPDFPGDARQEVFGVIVNNELYIWGGFSYSTPFAYDDGWKLSHQGGTWNWKALPSLPWKVCSSGIATIGTKIYVLGGADYDTNAFYTEKNRSGGNPNLGAHLLALDTADLAGGWQQLPDCPGTPRWVHTMSAVNGKLYVIGGATGDSVGAALPYCSVVDNWLFDPSTGVWSRLVDLPISSGNFPNGSNIVFENRYIILVGGFQYGCAFNNRVPIPPYGTGSKAPQPNQTYFADMFVYDTVTGLFGTADKLPLNNNLPMAVVRGNEIFLMGGETGGSWLTDHPTGATYDPNGEYFGHHPDLCLTGQIQVATIRPDFDQDRDVDQRDFDVFVACVTGPGVPYDPQALPVGCALVPTQGIIPADLDGDSDVDQDDFGIFQRCMTAPGGPVILGCDR